MKAAIFLYLGIPMLSLADLKVNDEYDVLELTNGTKYEQVKITKILPDGISIFHDGGLARVPVELLPDTMREGSQFGSKEEIETARKMRELERESSRRTLAEQDALRMKQEAERKENTPKEEEFRIVTTTKYTPEYENLLKAATDTGSSLRNSKNGWRYTSGPFKGKTKGELIEIVKQRYAQMYPGKSIYVQHKVRNEGYDEHMRDLANNNDRNNNNDRIIDKMNEVENARRLDEQQRMFQMEQMRMDQERDRRAR